MKQPYCTKSPVSTVRQEAESISTSTRVATPHDEWPVITLNHALISARNNPCHTSTEHVSSPSAQETSYVWSDCDGGHMNSAERCAGTSPDHTSKIETCASCRRR